MGAPFEGSFVDFYPNIQVYDVTVDQFLFDLADGSIGPNFSANSFVDIELKSNAFYSRSQSEYPHFFSVLPIGDEFRERIVFCGTHEKFRKCLAQGICHDKFRWRNAGTNGSQPGAERVPNELGGNDSEILEQPLGDNAGLHESMIGVHFAFDTVSVIFRRAM